MAALTSPGTPPPNGAHPDRATPLPLPQGGGPPWRR